MTEFEPIFRFSPHTDNDGFFQTPFPETDTPGQAELGQGVNEYAIRTLPLPHARAILIGYSPATDNQLRDTAQKAVESNAPELLAQLPGNHTTILSNNNDRTLHIVTDPVGVAPPVYYRHNGETTTIGLQPGSLLEGGTKNVDRAAAAALLAIPGAEGSLLADNSSISGVSKVPPGSILHVTDTGLSVTSCENLAPSEEVSLEEAAESLATALRSAIAKRLADSESVSADLSGGIDSSSVAFLLADLVDDMLPAFFAKNPDFKEGDEHYAQHYSTLSQKIHLRVLEYNTSALAFSASQYDALPSFEDASMATISPRGLRYVSEYYRQLATFSRGVHFTGHGGDELLHTGAAYLPNLLLCGDIRRFFGEGMAIARMSNKSPLEVWKQASMLAALSPEKLLMHSAAKLMRETNKPTSAWTTPKEGGLWNPSEPGVGWLTSGTRQELANLLEERAQTLYLPEALRIGDFIARERIYSAAIGNTGFEQYVKSLGLGIRPYAPLLDRDVVRAVFSTRIENRGDIRQFKLILSQALADLVPPEVVTRRTKGFHDAELHEAFRLSVPTLQQILNTSILAEIGLIEPNQLHSALSTMGAKPSSDLMALERLLSLERWARGIYGEPDSGAKQTRSFTVPEPLPKLEIGQPAPKYTSEDKPDTYLQMPHTVHVLASEQGALALYDTQRDRFHLLNPTNGNFLRAFMSTGDLTSAVAQLRTLYPKVDPTIIHADLSECIGTLVNSQLLLPSKVRSTRSLPTARETINFSADEHVITRGENEPKLSVRERLLAIATLSGAVVLTRCLPWLRKPLLDRLRESSAGYVSMEQAQRYQLASQSLPFLGRVACAEAPYSAALMAAATRRHLDWKVGVSFSPISFHAWVETEGIPVRTPRDGPVIGEFESFF